MHRAALEALKHFTAAVAGDQFAEARMNVGLLTLGFRNYTAARKFQAVIDLQPKNADAFIGL
jgi:hypothetical protein